MRTQFLLLLFSLFGILYAQNVGIGTPIPAAKLDVRGDFRLSNSASNYVNFALPASSQTTNYTLPASAGTNGQFLQTDGTGTLSWSSLLPSTWSDYIIVEEQKPALTVLPSVVGFQTRQLNTVTASNGSSISFNSVTYTITILPGTYHIVASVPACQTANHQMVLRNTTTLAPIALGQSSHADGQQTFSNVDCIITVGTNTTFKLDHYVSQANSNGLGISGGNTGVNNVFARCLVQKIEPISYTSLPPVSPPSSWSDYLLVYEQKPNGAVCGSATAGGFTQRDLTNVQASAGTAISFNASAHSITLNQVGTYYIKASAPCHRGFRHQLIIRGLPSNNVLLTGTSEYSANGGGDTPDPTRSFIEGFLTINTPTTFDLAHFIQSNGGGTETLGIANAAASGLVGNFAHCFVQKIETPSTSINNQTLIYTTNGF